MNSSCGTHEALYATQSLPVTCWLARKAVGPSVLGLVLVHIGGIPDLILKGDRQRHTVCLASDKFSHDIKRACSLACQFIFGRRRTIRRPGKSVYSQNGALTSQYGGLHKRYRLTQLDKTHTYTHTHTHTHTLADEGHACTHTCRYGPASESRENSPIVVLTMKTVCTSATEQVSHTALRFQVMGSVCRCVCVYTSHQQSGHIWHEMRGIP